MDSPKWQFWAVVVTIVFSIPTIFISVIALYQSSTLYDIQAVILANTSLVEIKEGFTNDIKILYKGQVTNNLSLVQVKLENTGNQPIRTSDYEEPISFVFPNSSNVITATVLESAPENIKIPINIQKNVVTLNPVLFNPQDRIIFRFLIISTTPLNTSQTFNINARIANVKKIQILSAIDQAQKISHAGTYVPPIWASVLGTIAVLFGIIVVILVLSSLWRRLSSVERLALMGLIFIVAMIWLIARIWMIM